MLAVDDGQVRFGQDPLGGTIAVLAPSGVPIGLHWYYAHLSAVEGTARAVKAGDIIGYVGRSGDAAPPGIPTHLHFAKYTPTPTDPLGELQAAPRVTLSNGKTLSVGAALAVAGGAIVGSALLAWWLTR